MKESVIGCRSLRLLEVAQPLSCVRLWSSSDVLEVRVARNFAHINTAFGVGSQLVFEEDL